MSKATRLQRKHQRAPADAQRGFGFAPGSFGERPQPPKKDGIPKARLPNFEAPDPFAIDINGVPVSAYLERTDQGWIVRLVEMLGDLDWSGFFPNYKPTGRPPVHPRLFLGLVVYGLLLGRSSLRDLETLARLDLGAWLVCAGLQPDHSSIGKFLQRHDALLTESYFEDLTKQLVARLKLGRGLAAIDGTVVAAAASRLSTLKLEAARQAAKEAAAKANALAQAQATGTPKPDAPPNPDLVAEASAEAQTSPSSSSDPTPDDQVPPGGVSSPTRSTPAPVPPSASAEREPQGTSASAALQEAQAQAAAAGEIARVAEARSATAQHPERIAVVPGELDAVIQPLKNGANHPSYKPSVIVHESGLIVGKAVDPSSETAVVADLRAQHQRILGGDPLTTLLDAGYNCHEILKAFAEQDILCPAGTLGADFLKRGGKGLFGKSAFRFDETADAYRCPGGQTLTRTSSQVDRESRRYTNYQAGAAVCAACPLKGRCTKAGTRTVSRYEGDDLKEAMAQVMTQPAARKAFRQRAAIVEPVYASLKERQGLRRFRRRGLPRVRLEFSLHCIAYNLGRALSLERRSVVFFVVRARLSGAPWSVIGMALVFA